MAKILLQEDKKPPREVAVNKSVVTIGREDECEIHLDEEHVSRKHARIRYINNAFYIEDMGSTNGVLLNEKKISRSALQDGDQIAIHNAKLTFVDDGADVAEVALPVVEIDNVSKEYMLGRQVVVGLQDISFTVAKGEFMALAGPSGSGKSTLLNLIGCIDTPSSGSIHIEGQDVGGKSPDELSDLRLNTLGFVFQTFNLLPVLSAWENVEYPLLQKKTVSRDERHARVAHYLNMVGLKDYMHHRPNELSGGQRQRVAIARALATRPSIVLADEPTANLDHRTGAGILMLMKELNQHEGTTFIFSTHDARVMKMADRVVELADGQIIKQGEYSGH